MAGNYLPNKNYVQIEILPISRNDLRATSARTYYNMQLPFSRKFSTKYTPSIIIKSIFEETTDSTEEVLVLEIINSRNVM